MAFNHRSQRPLSNGNQRAARFEVPLINTCGLEETFPTNQQSLRTPQKSTATSSSPHSPSASLISTFSRLNISHPRPLHRCHGINDLKRCQLSISKSLKPLRRRATDQDILSHVHYPTANSSPDSEYDPEIESLGPPTTFPPHFRRRQLPAAQDDSDTESEEAVDAVLDMSDGPDNPRWQIVRSRPY